MNSVYPTEVDAFLIFRFMEVKFKALQTVSLLWKKVL